jgi:large repetitive protein
MRSKPWLWLTALALLVAIAAPVLGEPRPVGTEFLVNANIESRQRNPVAAFNAAGTALVVWENERDGIRGRFYGRDGAPLTGELALVANQKLQGLPANGVEVVRTDPAAAFLPSGEFLLAWTEERADVRVDIFIEQRHLIDRDVYLQKFSAAGSPLGTPVRLNGTTAGNQNLPRILVRNGADAVVVWQSQKGGVANGVFGRLVGASGSPNGGEFKISQGANPAIAGKPNGTFLVAWEASDGSNLGVFARAFDRGARPAGDAFRVNTDVMGQQVRPAVTADRTTGGWLVVWQGQTGNWRHAAIFGQFVGAAGNLVGPQFRSSVGVGPTQVAPSVAASQGSNFLVAWVDYKENFPLGIFGVEIDRLGNRIGSEVKLNSQPINYQTRTAVAVSPFGGVLAPWEGFTPTDRSAISARRVEF